MALRTLTLGILLEVVSLREISQDGKKDVTDKGPWEAEPCRTTGSQAATKSKHRAS